MGLRFIFLFSFLTVILSISAQENTKITAGDIAADFTFIDNHGREAYMSEINSDYIVLFFYNPDCEHCHQYLTKMKQDNLLKDFVAQKVVSVIAVAVESSQEEFMNTFYELPILWYKGYCEQCEEIIDNYLMKVPAIFVLDDTKTVVLSDISTKELKSFLKNIDK
ncbi:MAG: thioredoxin family protein [Bacteroidales bacterium]|jgi:thiol-disulfide isomerase/thioredoxin|nr:thioredoxin family protein [Bacteroidales bacterium]